MKKVSTLILSDTNVDPIKRFLQEKTGTIDMDVATAPYNQVNQVLMNPLHPVWNSRPDVSVIWTTPERLNPAFEALLQFKPIDINQILNTVDKFAAMVIEASERCTFTFVVSWSLPPYYRWIQTLAWKHNRGITNILMQMNLRLAEHFAAYQNIIILDSQYWYSAVQKQSYDAKMYSLGKIQFSRDFFIEAANEIKSILLGLLGESKKLIVCDLDNTLWGGIIGDDGLEGVRLGGIDPVGESFVLFQKGLKALKNRGILLAICSKNEESIALEMIETHPEMILKKEDFVGLKINWQDKAQNIVELANELNLGLQSIVFLDDNPLERDRVRQALPEVYVPDLPTEFVQYSVFIQSLDCFETNEITAEDLTRTTLYQQEFARKSSISTASSIDSWLESLDIQVTVMKLDRNNLGRAVQLLNKTNQFNMSTRRLGEEDFWQWAQETANKVFLFAVKDRFGEQGITGLISTRFIRTAKIDASITSKYKNEAEIVDFVMSCRVMGKGIEDAMLHFVLNDLIDAGVVQVKAVYQKTKKNKPFFDFIKDKYTKQPSDTYLESFDFMLDIHTQKQPAYITIIDNLRSLYDEQF